MLINVESHGWTISKKATEMSLKILGYIQSLV